MKANLYFYLLRVSYIGKTIAFIILVLWNGYILNYPLLK